MACLVGAWGLTRTPLLRVDRVQVTTDPSVPTAEVLAVTGLGRHPQLLDVHPGVLQARLDRLAWVATARVSRSFPHTVRVVVTTRHPVAQFDVHGTYVEIDRTGRELARAAHAWSGLPALSGTLSAASADAHDGILAVAAALPASLRPQVTSIGPAADGLALHLRDGIEADLGPPTDLAAKAAAVQVLLSHADLQGVRVMEVQVPSMPVLTTAGG